MAYVTIIVRSREARLERLNRRIRRARWRASLRSRRKTMRTPSLLNRVDSQSPVNDNGRR